MIRSILGHFHQGCHIFQPYNGMQMHCCCTDSFVDIYEMCKQHIIWKSRFRRNFSLRNIFVPGHCRNNRVTGYLSHNQLPASVTFRQERCQVSYVLYHFYGTINGEINLEAQQTCFYEAFSQAILSSNFQLLTVNDLTVAIYIDTTRNLFYLFD